MGRLSREKLVAIITEYYTLLNRMYLPNEALKFPPTGGWPNITPEIADKLKDERSEDVIQLMRFLPYISEDMVFEGTTDVEYKTRVIDWSTCQGYELRGVDFLIEDVKEYIAEREADRVVDGDEDSNEEESEEVEAAEEAGQSEDQGANAECENKLDEDDEAVAINDSPADTASASSKNTESAWSYNDEDPMDYANFLQLAVGHESCSWNIWLDTYGCSIHTDQVRAGGWQGIEPVEDYFADRARQLEALEIVPVPRSGGDMEWLEMDMSGQDQEKLKRFASIYHDCGWPGNEYRKEEAMEKIRVTIEEEDSE